MASSYTTRLRLEKPGIGEQDGTWGGTASTDFDLIDASFGSASITHDDTANYSLTTNNGAADEARAFVYVIGGTLTAARNAIVPTASKVFIAHNNTSGGYAITVKTSGGSGVSVANGKKKLLYCDGTDVVDAATVVGNANLEAIAALAVTDGNIIVGDGSTWVAESGATARTSLGAGDTNGPGSATDNAVARFDGTGGKTLQNSVVTIADGGDLTAAGTGATAWLVQGTGGTVTHCLDRTDTHGDNVLVGTLEFRGRDSGGANQAYGFIDARCVLDDAGAETGALEFRIGNAGTATQRLYLRTGLYTPNATGGDKGADTINASAIYDDGVQIHPSGTAKVWGYVTYSSGTPTLQASFNVNSITDTGTGRLTVTIETDFASTNYAMVAMNGQPTNGNSTMERVANRAAGSFEINVTNFGNTLVDPDSISFLAFGAQ